LAKMAFTKPLSCAAEIIIIIIIIIINEND